MRSCVVVLGLVVPAVAFGQILPDPGNEVEPGDNGGGRPLFVSVPAFEPGDLVETASWELTDRESLHIGQAGLIFRRKTAGNNDIWHEVDSPTTADLRGIWGTGGVAIWGTGGVAIWGTGGVAIWGTGGVAVPGSGATWQNDGVVHGAGPLEALAVGDGGSVVGIAQGNVALGLDHGLTDADLAGIWGTGGVAIAVGEDGVVLELAVEGDGLRVERLDLDLHEDLVAVGPDGADGFWIEGASGAVYAYAP